MSVPMRAEEIGECRVMNRGDLITRIVEAYEVWRRVPDPELKYRKPKWGTWPLYVRDFAEAYGWHEARVVLVRPTIREIDRAEEVLDWFAEHLGETYKKEAQACWLICGRGLSPSEAGYKMRVSAKTAKRKRDAGLGLLIWRLNGSAPIAL